MRTQPELPVVRLDKVRQALFVVGRIRKGEQQLVFLRSRTRPPIPGPWELRAILAE